RGGAVGGARPLRRLARGRWGGRGGGGPLAPPPPPPLPLGAAHLVPAVARRAPEDDGNPRLTAGPAGAAGRLRLPPAVRLRDGPVPGPGASGAAGRPGRKPVRPGRQARRLLAARTRRAPAAGTRRGRARAPPAPP